ncbi:MAG: hypothetical protein FDZ69_06540 [Deltaproteobacteria bacterium]|nr:MAG: hypothetical protein FDZ69_06540 [Deltaproteobacteria bacterium]
MRTKSNNALTYQKAIHEEIKNLEECPEDTVAEVHLALYREKALAELESVPHQIVAGECLPTDYTTHDVGEWAPVDTLMRPTSIHQTASLDRLSLAEKTGYQELCIDAADTIGAQNSLEKMLAHQMAVCHVEGMKLIAKANKTRDVVVAQKILSTATRFMDIYLKGFEAIHRVKRGNRQTVVVKYQQVNVGDGGQAVITEPAGGIVRRGDAQK